MVRITSGCLVVRLSGCLVVWLPDCLAVWLSGYLAVWLSGCPAVWLSSFLSYRKSGISISTAWLVRGERRKETGALPVGFKPPTFKMRDQYTKHFATPPLYIKVI